MYLNSVYRMSEALVQLAKTQTQTRRRMLEYLGAKGDFGHFQSSEEHAVYGYS